MEFAFYFASGVAVVSTLRVITNTNPVHALLYLIISLIAVAMTFFSLGAPFAGVLEVIAFPRHSHDSGRCLAAAARLT